MLTLNDIINASFRKSGFSGYRTDDVDRFIDQVKESYDSMIKADIEQKEALDKTKAENDQLREKLKILAQKVEDYRSEEEEIKNALVSAQKLGDASVRESRHKAEIIIKDANLKAERIIAGANQEIEEQKRELERLQQDASDFRSRLLGLYKEHLTLINALPVKKPEAEQQEPVREVSAPPAAQEPVGDKEFLNSFQKPTEEESSDPQFRAEVSTFDDTQAFETVPSHYTAIKFGDETPNSAMNANTQDIAGAK